jgi:hypothetical protein
VTASFALPILNLRTAGTCQGFTMPRPAGAPLTEPVRPQKRFLIRGQRKQIEVSHNPGAIIGSGSSDGGRPLDLVEKPKEPLMPLPPVAGADL